MRGMYIISADLITRIAGMEREGDCRGLPEGQSFRGLAVVTVLAEVTELKLCAEYKKHDRGDDKNIAARHSLRRCRTALLRVK